MKKRSEREVKRKIERDREKKNEEIGENATRKAPVG